MPSLALACRLSAVSMALRRAFPGAFDPASLFANGEQGLWYDMSDFDRYMSELGPELVSGGENFVDASSTPGVATYDGTTLVLTASSGVARGRFRLNTAANKGYVIRLSATATSSFDIGTTAGGSQIAISLTASTNTSVFFRATGAETWINFYVFSGGANTVSGLSVRELTAIDTLTLFQDAAGTIPVTAVEQPVGLILDKSKGLVLGPELWSASLPLNGAVNAGWSYADGVFTSTSAPNYSYPSNQYLSVNVPGVVAGRSYKAMVVIAGSGTAGIAIGTSNVAVFGFRTAGTYEYTWHNTSSAYLGVVVQSGSGFVGTISVLSIRELPGNHAYQANTLSRGILRARYNLLTYSEDFSNPAWAKNLGINVTGTKKLVPTTASVAHKTQNSQASGLNNVTGQFTMRFRAKADGYNIIAPWFDIASVGARFNVSDGTVVSSTGVVAGTTPTIVPDGDGYYKCEVTVSVTNGTLVVYVVDNANNVSFSGDGTSGILVDWIDVRPANLPANLPPCQRIAAATDYDTVGFPVYLDPDGTDDSYQTGSIDFTGTDKMTIWAGLRKADDTARAFFEYGPRWFDEIATGPNLQTGDGTNAYLTSAKASGKSYAASQVASIPHALATAPDSAVITAQHDIAGDLSRIRRNGSSDGAIDGTADKGTGNFGNYPLYLFSRGGTTVRWKGHFYALIIRGAATDTTQLEQTEQWLNSKMGGIY